MFGNAISNMMVKPHQSPLFDDPANYGLDFENVEFETSDGATLKGWLIQGGTDRVIVQTHFGVQCNRAGYDPKGKGLIKMWKTPIAFLRQAKHLQSKGYSVLMYDMRGHGESTNGPAPWVSWGPNEAQDVLAAVDFVSARPEFKDAEIGLLSICMGLSATTYAYGLEEGMKTRTNVKAMVGVQPLPYKEFVDAFGMPGFLQRAGEKVSRERLGFAMSEKTFLPDAEKVDVPTLIVQNRNDPWTSLDIVQAYYDALAVEKDVLWLDLSKDRAAAYDYLGTNPEFLSEWFDRHLGKEN